MTLLSRNQREGRMIIGRRNLHDVAYRKIAMFDAAPKIPTRYGKFDPNWQTGVYYGDILDSMTYGNLNHD